MNNVRFKQFSLCEKWQSVDITLLTPCRTFIQTLEFKDQENLSFVFIFGIVCGLCFRVVKTLPRSLFNLISLFRHISLYI